VLFYGPEPHQQLFVKVIYNPTINVPKIDIIITINMKIQSINTAIKYTKDYLFML